MDWEEQMHTHFWKENLKKIKHLEDLEIDDVDTVMSLWVPYSAGNVFSR
jgi:hypothetical protein